MVLKLLFKIDYKYKLERLLILKYIKNQQLSYNLFLFIFLKGLLSQKDENRYQKYFLRQCFCNHTF